MFTISQVFHIFFWPFLILIIFVVGAVILRLFFGKATETEEEEVFPYEKKPFVFDTMSELTLYRLLVELFGGRYYIFPQVVYSRLIQLKRGESLKYRTHFDKKIADFVLCAKEKAVAQLVVELDGSSHLSEKKIERDGMVDKMMEQIGLPILHLKTGNMDKEFIKSEIDKILDKSQSFPVD